MNAYWLKFKLLSDATFGRGDGVASVVDSEVQHNRYGLPYLAGRALKGLLESECADILFALEQQGKLGEWKEAARCLFGGPGSTDQEIAVMRVGNARLPEDIRRAVRVGIQRGELRREQVLESLTSIRYQTSIDAKSGAPSRATLRATRVILRQTPFEAQIQFTEEPTKKDKALLAACVLAWRRGGTGRNRGRGELKAHLFNAQQQEVSGTWFDLFKSEVTR
jgi:hypothetical protein